MLLTLNKSRICTNNGTADAFLESKNRLPVLSLLYEDLAKTATAVVVRSQGQEPGPEARAGKGVWGRVPLHWEWGIEPRVSVD